MALGIYTSAAFTTASGIAVAANADVEVRRESDSGLASIYSDRAGSTPITQPGFQADANGRFEFYAAGIEGGYKITVTKGAESQTERYQATGTGREFDASSYGGSIMGAADAATARNTLGASSGRWPLTLGGTGIDASGIAKGGLLVGNGAGSVGIKTAGTDGYVVMNDSDQAAGIDHVPADFHFKNLLLNPDGRFAQRGLASTADDAYFADRWYILSQTGAVTPSALSAPEDGYPVGIRITQSQASAQRFGFAQIIEGQNCKHLRGQSGVLVPRVRISASQALRYAILGWTGTEDSVTSDVVNDWTSSTYTAGNFFLGSNLSVLAVGSATPSASTWTSLAKLSGSLGTSFNNIIVMVWTEGTAAQNFTLDFDYVQFERGAIPTAFERRPPAVELELCKRYYQKTFPLATTPAQAAGTTGADACAQPGPASTSIVVLRTELHPPMRAAPTVTTYNVINANPEFHNSATGTDYSGTTATAAGPRQITFTGNSPTGSSAGQLVYLHWTAAAEL